jgi:protein-tyrosine phosphatase
MPYTDFHNHLIPGVDDGARDAGFSAGALRAFRQVGVSQVIVTPHFNGSLTATPSRFAERLAELDAGWDVLRGVVDADAAAEGARLRVERGVEVMLDIPAPDLSDPRLRLAGTRYVLVEFPGLQLPPVNASVAVELLRRGGWTPVIAHPERYRNLESLIVLHAFVVAGGLLQVNAGSLVGEYGPDAQRFAQQILGSGLASFVCSDYHARGEPATGRFARALAESGYSEQAELLLGVNPARLLADEPPVAVPPMAMMPAPRAAVPWWKRMLGG